MLSDPCIIMCVLANGFLLKSNNIISPSWLNLPRILSISSKSSEVRRNGPSSRNVKHTVLQTGSLKIKRKVKAHAKFLNGFSFDPSQLKIDSSHLQALSISLEILKSRVRQSFYFRKKKKNIYLTEENWNNVVACLRSAAVAWRLGSHGRVEHWPLLVLRGLWNV